MTQSGHTSSLPASPLELVLYRLGDQPMRRRAFLVTIGAALWPLHTLAQQTGRIYRIGYLGPGSSSVLPDALDAFRQQLTKLGYHEGQNLLFEYRWANERDDQLGSLAKDLVGLNVDAIVVEGHTPAILAAKQATSTIPIIMAVSGDPVGVGLVQSLARPGGNVTGMTLLTPELAGKRLALLKDVVTGLGRVGVLWNASNPVKALDWHETQVAAAALNLKLQSLEVNNPSEFDKTFQLATTDRPDALVVFPDGLVNSHRKQIVDFANKTRLPGMYPSRSFVSDGGLMSYAPSYRDLFRRASVMLVKILQGAKPESLPVEQPTQFELIINLKTAKSLNLAVSQGLLNAADEVIE